MRVPLSPICLFLFFLAVSGMTPEPAKGAACCGGAGVMPALMTGDQKGEVSASFQVSEATAQRSPQGLLFPRAEGALDRTSKITLTGSSLLSDAIQLGGQFSIVNRSLRIIEGIPTTSLTDAGDLSLSLGYEALPEHTYSRWKPRGFVFLSTTLPLGPSVHERDPRFEDELRALGTSDGVQSVSTGWVLTKNHGQWDWLQMTEISKSFGKTFADAIELGGQQRVTVQWGLGRTWRGAWLSGGDLRGGFRLSGAWKSERESVDLMSATLSRTTATRIFTPSLDLTWMPDSWTRFALAFQDPKLLSTLARGVTLERSVSFSFARTWER